MSEPDPPSPATREPDPEGSGAAPPVEPSLALEQAAASVAARLRAERSAFRRRAWLVLAAVSVVALGLDQWSKHWAHTTLRFEHGGRLALVEGYLDLAYVRNPGAAWGFLARSHESFRQPFFIGISLVAMLFILYLFLRLETGQHLLLYALSLVMGGALGNFVDRLRFQYVIDFIELHLQHRHRWPTFNVADMAITIGVGLLFVEMFLSRKRARPEPPRTEGAR